MLVLSTVYKSYLYTYNFRGDVVGVYDSAGNLKAKYEYDAWGKVLSVKDANGNAITSATHIGNLNPFRYRSYYLDSETGLYYLMSRYYDPVTRRFVNSDEQLSKDVLGNNLFAYCGNNPIIRADNGGQAWWVVAGAVVGGIAGGVAQAVSNVATGKKWNTGIIGATVGGAFAGAVIAATGGTALATAGTYIAAFGGAALTSVTNETLSYIPAGSQLNGQSYTKKVTSDNMKNSVMTVATDTVVNGTASVATGYIANKIIPINNNGWFKPKKLISSFTGKYARKVQLQTLVQSPLDISVNVFGSSATEQQSTVCFYPNTKIRAAR